MAETEQKQELRRLGRYTLVRRIASGGMVTMTDDALLRRIVVDPAIFAGKPIIRGMRISVELILSLLAQGESIADIRADYPELEEDDIRACIAYAHAVVANESLDAVAISGR